MQTLEQFFLNSRDVRYFKVGKGDPILFLHGFAETYRIWDIIYPKFSDKYMLIIPEIPGCGNNNSYQDLFSMETIAEFVNDILEQENIQQIVLFGHSMGGYAAMAFAEKYSHKLLGLSLVHSSAQADTMEKKAIRQSAIRFISKNGKEHFIKTLIPKLYASTKGLEELYTQHIKMFNQYSAEQIINCYTAMLNRPDRTSVLQQLNCPIQFIGGLKDQSIDYKQLELQAKLCKKPSLTFFEGIGHTSMHENSLFLIEAINGFLDDIFQTN